MEQILKNTGIIRGITKYKADLFCRKCGSEMTANEEFYIESLKYIGKGSFTCHCNNCNETFKMEILNVEIDFKIVRE